MGARRDRFDMRMADQALSRKVNGKMKIAERDRRSARLADLLHKGKFPYTPTLRSWISQVASPSPSSTSRPSRLCLPKKPSSIH